MTDKNKSLLVFLVDRSGSMASIAADMEGGFKTLIEENKKVSGECAVSVYTFDSQSAAKDAKESFPSKICENVDINDQPKLVIMPRGSTALCDALGMTITTVGQQLAALSEDKRPGVVVFTVITDGQENASMEFTPVSVKKMIEHQEKTYGWKFAFLGSAGIDDAKNMGFAANSTSGYSATKQGVGVMYQSVGKSMRSYRTSRLDGDLTAELNIDVPDDDAKS